MAATGQPFSMDTAMQIAHTQHFKGLVDSTKANNTQMQGIADSAMAANSGQMSMSFQNWLMDIHQTATSNNAILDQISDALHMGISTTDTTEASNAASFQQLTGAVSSPFSGGAHFG